MGNKAAKTTNNMLGEQKERQYGLAGKMDAFGNEDRGVSNDIRNFALDKYKSLYGDLEGGGFGGGGGGATLNLPGLRDNEAMGTYRNFMKTGGMSPIDIADYRRRASATGSSMFEGMKRNLAEAAGIRGGGYAGYGTQLGKLARDKANAANEAAYGSEVDLQRQLREGKLSGAGGVERLDRERMGAEEGRAREAYNAANAAAGARGANAQQSFRDRMALLSELRGLRGEGGSDLGYFDREGAALGGGLNAINSRVAEPSFGQQALGVVGGLAGAAAPFIPMFSKKKPGGSNTGVSGYV